MDAFTEELRAVEVGAGLTIWLTVPELPLKLPSAFEYTALTVCGKPPLTARVVVHDALLTVRVAIAEPAAAAPESGSKPPHAAPSMENWTDPVGVAVFVVSVTVAVNVTACPKVDGLTEEVTVTVVEQT